MVVSLHRRVVKNAFFVHPKARATSSCLLQNTLWIRPFKNAFKAEIVNLANSLSPPSIVRKVLIGSKNNKGTYAMLGKSQGS